MSAPALAVPLPQSSPHLTLDPASHTYRYDGRVVPGVTDTLRRAGIIDYTGVPRHILDHAAERGRNVHLAIQYLQQGSLDPASVSEEIAPYLRAWARFIADTNLIPGSTERSRINLGRWYAGTFDMTAFYGHDLDRDNPSPVLVDWKSGEFFEGHFAQLAAYTGFFPNPRRFRPMAVQLKADSQYRVHEMPAAKFDYYLNTFHSALACVRFAGERRA